LIEIEIYIDLRNVAVLDLLQQVARILLVHLVQLTAEIIQRSLVDHFFLYRAGSFLDYFLSVRRSLFHLCFEDSVLPKIEDAATSGQVIPRILRIRLRDIDVHHGHVLGSDVSLEDRRCGDHVCACDWLLLPALKIVEVFTVGASENVTDLLDISQVLRRSRRSWLVIEGRVVLRWHEDLAVVADLVLVGVRIRVIGLLDCVVLAACIIHITCLVLQDDAVQLLEIWYVIRAHGCPQLAVQFAILNGCARFLILVEMCLLRYDLALLIMVLQIVRHLIEVTG
jgi:hypothetical protein